MDVSFRVFVYGNTTEASTKGQGKLCLCDRHAPWSSFIHIVVRAILGEEYTVSTYTDKVRIFFLPNGEELTVREGVAFVHDKVSSP
jgi:hypothetical protein